jgi:hypothetical protein
VTVGVWYAPFGVPHPWDSAMADPPGPAAGRAVLFGAARAVPAFTNRQGDTVIAVSDDLLAVEQAPT